MNYIPISECKICSKLADREYAFSKYGSPDSDKEFPKEVCDLICLQSVKDYIRRCPVCGTFYIYESSYEFLIGGSEDEQILTRLTPDESKEYLTSEEYRDIMDHLALEIEKSKDEKVLFYAIKSYIIHYIIQNEEDSINKLFSDSRIKEKVIDVLWKISGQHKDAIGKFAENFLKKNNV